MSLALHLVLFTSVLTKVSPVHRTCLGIPSGSQVFLFKSSPVFPPKPDARLLAPPKPETCYSGLLPAFPADGQAHFLLLEPASARAELSLCYLSGPSKTGKAKESSPLSAETPAGRSLKYTCYPFLLC